MKSKRTGKVDPYKMISDNAIERFLAFLIDCGHTFKGKRLDNKRTKQFVLTYLKICIKQKAKYDKSLDKRYIKAINNIFSMDKDPATICNIIGEMLFYNYINQTV